MTMRNLHALLPALLLGGLLSAQSYTVSPPGYASTSGNSSNTFPLNYPSGRYQQVHGDLKGTPRLLQGLSLRKGSTTSSTGTARTVSLTVIAGDSNYALASTTFASNYVGTPVTVKPQGTVNCPDWTTSQGTPEPWSIVIPFTVPFPYTGVHDLAWEFLLHSNTASGSYFADAASSSDTANAIFTTHGTGCIVGANRSPMTQRLRIYTAAAAKTLNLTGTIAFAPPSVPALTMLSPVNANLTIPGLCEKLYVLPIWQFATVTNSSGSSTLPAVATTHDPNWAGLKLFAQTVAPDVGQTGIPLALTSGLEATLPGFATTFNVARVYYRGSTTSASGTLQTGYGLITRLTH